MYYPLVFVAILLFSLWVALKILFSQRNFVHLDRIGSYLKPQVSIIWLLAIIYAAFFSYLSILKYRAYNMALYDLGRMDQAIWNTLHGRFLFGTFEFGNACRMIAHSEIIYALIAPLYLIYSSPITLLVLQSVVISLGVFGVYWLAKMKLGGYFTPLCFSLVYLLNPSLQYGNLVDFHPDMLATTFLIFTFYFMERREWTKYFIFLTLSLLCKEYVSFILITLALYMFIKRKNIYVSNVTLILGILWFILTYKVIPGFLQNGKENKMVEYCFSHFGTTTMEISKNIILHPFTTFQYFFNLKNIANFIFLLLPVGFLPIFSLPAFLICLPILSGIILSTLFSYANHHNGLVIPFIIISSILACKFIIDKFSSKYKNISYALGIFVLSCSLLSNILYGASVLSWQFWCQSSYRYKDNLQNYKITDHDRIADKIIKMVPSNAPVSASNHLASHLSQRETIYQFPYPKDFININYILVDLLEYFPPPASGGWPQRKAENEVLKNLLLDRNFYLAHSEDGILLFKKGVVNSEAYYLDIQKVNNAQPEHIINSQFDERLLLVGYDFKNNDFIKGKRHHIAYYWKVLKDFDKGFIYNYFKTTERLNTEYILIDSLQSQDASFRLVHLPTYVLFTPSDWKAGDLFREEFEFYLPENIPLGEYKWKIGCYAAPKNFFIETGIRNQVPQTELIDLGRVKIGPGKR